MKKRKFETNKIITLQGREINYTQRVSRQARRLRLTIQSDGRLVVTQPARLPLHYSEDFLRVKASWIITKLDNLAIRPLPLNPVQSREKYLQQKAAARRLALERLQYFNSFYGLTYNRLSIRDQKTRWGSCSKKGNLNFNYRIIELAPRVADYIIVHELCHLKEFNHSPRFWLFVAKTLPDYKLLRQKIRGNLI